MKTEFKLNFGRSDSARWERLLSEIDKGNVIPVIGVDLLTKPKPVHVGSETLLYENFHQQIISFIANKSDVKTNPRTFSQLVFDENYRKNAFNDSQIYELINQIITNIDCIDEIDNTPSDLLLDLLGTKKFPFVITTSFSPIIEDAMRLIWGDVKVLNFDKNPSTSSWEKGGDIRAKEELEQPTVFYMFGKYCDSAGRYAVTDKDMMQFCSAWISGNGTPKALTDALKNKYLLILGNSYSDWLFRFVWCCLRPTTDSMKSDVIVNSQAEESFKQFLNRLETFFQENPEEVITKIKTAMYNRAPIAPTKIDVFISYSHTDAEIAKSLYHCLKERGLHVWMDDKSIRPAEKWKAAINHGICNSRLFIPILSKNIEKEAMQPHEYRNEWQIASDLSQKMGGCTFIIPLVEKGFDFYNTLTDVPATFSEKNATWFSSSSDMSNMAEIVVDELNNLKTLGSKLNG